ncbi:hypothetical protein EQV77_06905 [Halobacillus fulvus]|nr:hypothetical protein EQV77_06905 [Halobacillus fulvus]
MRHDIQPNERAFTTKEVAEELGIATPTVRKYGQILERNGYEFMKDGDRRIFVRTDIASLEAIRDTERPKDDEAKELVEQQQERLASPNTTDVALSDTYGDSLTDPNQLREFLKLLSSELAATREMNTQLVNDMTELKTTVSRLRQDHHVISSGVGNFAQKTQTKFEKLTEQQKHHYESLLLEEKEKNEQLQQEIHNMRDEQRKEWQAQNDFNKRLEESMSSQPASTWGKILAIFRK